MKRFLIVNFIFVLLLFTAGCGKKPIQAAKAIVDTKLIQEEKIKEEIPATGRINAEFDVNIVARIDGYLQKKFFKEGAIVKKGDLLFQIEPYTYAAKVTEAEANLKSAQAAYIDAEKNLIRAQQLVKEDYISKADFDSKLAQRDQASAAVSAAQATLAQAKINYGYTKIYSPINGKIGEVLITEGNYVNPSSGNLALVVSIDPIFVDFTIKSKNYLALKKSSKVDDLSDISVEIKLSDDSIYPEKGKIRFIDNTVDTSSGSVQVRSIFNNKDSLLVPGDFVEVTLSLDTPKTVLMVPQEAVLESEKGKYVYVIDKDKKAQIRYVEVAEEYKGNWVLTSGLSIGDKVAISGLQNIRPDAEVVLLQELKAQKAAEAEIKEVGKPSLFKKLGKKIKNSIKKIMG